MDNLTRAKKYIKQLIQDDWHLDAIYSEACLSYVLTLKEQHELYKYFKRVTKQ